MFPTARAIKAPTVLNSSGGQICRRITPGRPRTHTQVSHTLSGYLLAVSIAKGTLELDSRTNTRSFTTSNIAKSRLPRSSPSTAVDHGCTGSASWARQPPPRSNSTIELLDGAFAPYKEQKEWLQRQRKMIEDLFQKASRERQGLDQLQQAQQRKERDIRSREARVRESEEALGKRAAQAGKKESALSEREARISETEEALKEPKMNLDRVVAERDNIARQLEAVDSERTKLERSERDLQRQVQELTYRLEEIKVLRNDLDLSRRRQEQLEADLGELKPRAWMFDQQEEEKKAISDAKDLREKTRTNYVQFRQDFSRAVESLSALSAHLERLHPTSATPYLRYWRLACPRLQSFLEACSGDDLDLRSRRVVEAVCNHANGCLENLGNPDVSLIKTLAPQIVARGHRARRLSKILRPRVDGEGVGSVVSVAAAANYGMRWDLEERLREACPTSNDKRKSDEVVKVQIKLLEDQRKLGKLRELAWIRSAPAALQIAWLSRASIIGLKLVNSQTLRAVKRTNGNILSERGLNRLKMLKQLMVGQIDDLERIIMARRYAEEAASQASSEESEQVRAKIDALCNEAHDDLMKGFKKTRGSGRKSGRRSRPSGCQPLRSGPTKVSKVMTRRQRRREVTVKQKPAIQRTSGGSISTEPRSADVNEGRKPAYRRLRKSTKPRQPKGKLKLAVQLPHTHGASPSESDLGSDAPRVGGTSSSALSPRSPCMDDKNPAGDQIQTHEAREHNLGVIAISSGQTRTDSAESPGLIPTAPARRPDDKPAIGISFYRPAIVGSCRGMAAGSLSKPQHLQVRRSNSLLSHEGVGVAPSSGHRNSCANPNDGGFWTYKSYKDKHGKEPRLVYCTNRFWAETVAASLLGEKVVGFDMEWVTNSGLPAGGGGEDVGNLKDYVSLVQIATDDTIALFHLARFATSSAADIMPPSLAKIITSESIMKTGVNIMGDATRLRNGFGLNAKGLFELSHLYKLVTYGASNPQLVNKVLYNMAAQVQDILGLPLSKGDVRTSDWTLPLSTAQQHYAATDAYAGLKLFQELERRRLEMDPTPPRPEFRERGKPILLANGKPPPKATRPCPPTSARDGGEVVDRSDDVQQAGHAVDPAAPPAAPGKEAGAKPSSSSSGQATARSCPKFEAAETWASAYMSEAEGRVRNRATKRTSKAYHLWHVQGLSPEEVAGVLSVRPSTALNYILKAVLGDSTLKYDDVRMRQVCDGLYYGSHPKLQKILLGLKSSSRGHVRHI